ncbi:MAG: hypothetical protein ABIQ95_14480 [Bdellovibrionia bacterium]
MSQARITNPSQLTRQWTLFLTLALIAGALLRLTFVHDMEYKEDEEYNFIQTQLIGNSQPWPWYGIPSGVYIVNPGMSIWVFAVLAKLFGIHQPTDLAHAVQAFALLGICLIIPFALKFVAESERRIWLWAYALALVNPFLILYQRKLWPEPFLPFFTMITIMGWWKKSSGWGCLVWGLVGALLGQIHLSGFFFSAALFLWTVAWNRKNTRWSYWFVGSIIGALPLIPWAIYIIQHPIAHAITVGWNEILQFKFWAFWITDPLGLHLGNPLGLLRGPSQWDQISDFVRYPIIAGVPTYFCGLAHLLILITAMWIFGRAFTGKRLRTELFNPKLSKTNFLQFSAFLGFGLLMTATGVVIRRYYMAVAFPLEFIFLIQFADPRTLGGKRALGLLWACQLFISMNFVGYIHVNNGSTQGDYGPAFHLNRSRDLKQAPHL